MRVRKLLVGIFRCCIDRNLAPEGQLTLGQVKAQKSNTGSFTHTARFAGRLHEESNLAPSVLVWAKACFHRRQGHRPLCSAQVARDPIQLAWMVNQAVS